MKRTLHRSRAIENAPLGRLLLTVLVLLALPPAAQAVTLTSGGISFLHGVGERLSCTITNVGTKPITLETAPQIFGAQSDNSSQESTPTDCGTLPMPPGSSCSAETGPSPSCFTCYCKVSFTGSKKGVRALLKRNVSGGDVVAVPLQ